MLADDLERLHEAWLDFVEVLFRETGVLWLCERLDAWLRKR